MGIYVFSMKFLEQELIRDANDPNSSRDFGKDIIPYIVKNGKAVAHRFPKSCVRSSQEKESYWRDVGTVDAYWEANIDLTDIVPQLDLYDQDWPIWTFAEITPPAKFVHDIEGRRGSAVSSLVSGGCVVSGVGAEALAAVHRRARQFLLHHRERRDPALCQDRPLGASEECRDRPRRQDSGKARGRRGSGARCQALPAHARRASA